MTPKQQAFVSHYVANSGNATQAYISAGYSPNGAAQGAERLLRNVEVQQSIAGARARVEQMTEFTQQWVLSGLRDVALGALANKQYSAAARSFELVGKHLGMFSDKLVIEDLRTNARKVAEAEGLDPDEMVEAAERHYAMIRGR